MGRGSYLFLNDDGDGGLTVMEVLWVVRNYRDELEEEKWLREQEVIAATGFSLKEVTQFREVFAEADDDLSGFLSEQEVMEVVGLITPLDAKKRRELRDKLEENDEDGDGQTSFPEFIQLMAVVMPPEAKKRESQAASPKGSERRPSKGKAESPSRQSTMERSNSSTMKMERQSTKGVTIQEEVETVTIQGEAEEEDHQEQPSPE